MSNILGEYLSEWEGENEINYLIHEYSRVYLNKADSLNELKLEKRKEILEARLFNSKKELFIYKYNDEWQRVLTIHDNENKDFIDKEYELEDRFQFKSIRIRKYVDYEDNMAYVKKTCLLDLRGVKNNG